MKKKRLAKSKRQGAAKKAHIAEPIFGMAKVHEIVETAFLTARLERTLPVSVVLISLSGSGKSTIVKRYECDDWIMPVDDLTSTGLWDALQADNRGLLRFFRCHDMNVTFSHNPVVVNLATSSLTTVMSDGSMRIQDGRKQKELKHAPAGLIGALTPELFYRHLKAAHANGLLRRHFPIRYELEPRLVEAIMRRKAKGVREPDDKVNPLRLSPNDDMKALKVELPESIAERLTDKAQLITANAGVYRGWQVFRDSEGKLRKERVWKKHSEDFYPMGTYEMLCAFAKAHALRDGRMKVNETDLVFCSELVGFCRLDAPTMINADGSVTFTQQTKQVADSMMSYPCDKCPEIFYTQRELIEHKSEHGKKQVIQ